MSHLNGSSGNALSLESEHDHLQRKSTSNAETPHHLAVEPSPQRAVVLWKQGLAGMAVQTTNQINALKS